MFDNLVSPNLSGLTGTIRYDNAVEVVPYILDFIFTIIFLFLLFGFLMFLFNKIIYPKSRRYRELLSDMYVVGKIKQIALEDKVDLNKELKDFIKLDKSLGMNDKSIDQVIENDLKERIVEDSEKNK